MADFCHLPCKGRQRDRDRERSTRCARPWEVPDGHRGDGRHGRDRRHRARGRIHDQVLDQAVHRPALDPLARRERELVRCP
jgi:hypothetical protein